MKARCRTAPACSLSRPPPKSTLPLFTPAGRLQLGHPISRSGVDFSTNFPHVVRHSAFVEIPPRCPVQHHQSTSSASGLSEESHTEPPIPFQGRLTSHCCSYCCCSAASGTVGCSWRLFGTPCFSTGAPVMFFLVTNPAFQVAVNHWQASPNRCCCYHLPGCCFGQPTPRLLMLVALEAASPWPSWQQTGSSAN